MAPLSLQLKERNCVEKAEQPWELPWDVGIVQGQRCGQVSLIMTPPPAEGGLEFYPVFRPACKAAAACSQTCCLSSFCPLQKREQVGSIGHYDRHLDSRLALLWLGRPVPWMG